MTDALTDALTAAQARIAELEGERDDLKARHASAYDGLQKAWNDLTSAEARCAEMIDILTTLDANWSAYRDSDLSHYSAHNCLVDYKLFSRIRAALTPTSDGERG
jgi:hypothetical protein